jgi:hypothetical protein
VIAIIEKTVDTNGIASITVSEPTEVQKRGFPVKLPKPGPNHKLGTTAGKSQKRVPSVKIFRKEVEGNFVSKKLRTLRKLEEAEKFECHFADVVDFGSLKEAY